MMKRICFILIIVSLVSIDCKGKEIKPSHDFLLTQDALDVINVIKDAYEKKDETLIMEKTEPLISEAILKRLSFKEASLSLTVRMVRITDYDVRVNMNWTGQWLVDEKKLSNRGVATFVLQREKMRLAQIEGDNPFLIPHP